MGGRLRRPFFKKWPDSNLSKERNDLTQINRNKHIRGIEHVDEVTENMDHNTAIFYLNTCNGKTVVDGTEVESVANRVVIFPANTPHYVVSQTDTDRRRQTDRDKNYCTEEKTSIHVSHSTPKSLKFFIINF